MSRRSKAGHLVKRSDFYIRPYCCADGRCRASAVARAGRQATRHRNRFKDEVRKVKNGCLVRRPDPLF